MMLICWCARVKMKFVSNFQATKNVHELKDKNLKSHSLPLPCRSINAK